MFPEVETLLPASEVVMVEEGVDLLFVVMFLLLLLLLLTNMVETSGTEEGGAPLFLLNISWLRDEKEDLGSLSALRIEEEEMFEALGVLLPP